MYLNSLLMRKELSQLTKLFPVCSARLSPRDALQLARDISESGPTGRQLSCVRQTESVGSSPIRMRQSRESPCRAAAKVGWGGVVSRNDTSKMSYWAAARSRSQKLNSAPKDAIDFESGPTNNHNAGPGLERIPGRPWHIYIHLYIYVLTNFFIPQ